MKIIGEIGEAIRAVQATYGIDLQEIELRPEHREEILHVVIHETCHTAISHAAPWVNALPDTQHTAVDEIAARVLETEVSEQQSLYAHSVESHARELTSTDSAYLSTRSEGSSLFGRRCRILQSASNNYVSTFTRRCSKTPNRLEQRLGVSLGIHPKSQ